MTQAKYPHLIISQRACDHRPLQFIRAVVAAMILGGADPIDIKTVRSNDGSPDFDQVVAEMSAWVTVAP